ncbi:MAG: metallophosphoesterase family protein [Paludibacteraceae bacterium]|nr:metallophosphoesterase family protein [Paludibacteraceae bacterium]
MTKIGLISDTHGLLDKRVFEHFAPCDEIWHAGDIGSSEVLRALREFRPTRAVFGNIDGGEVRYSLSEFYRFRVEQVNVLMTHIGGYPGKYNPWLIPWFEKSLRAKEGKDIVQMTNHELRTDDTDTITNSLKDEIDLFVCGHSHILKVQYDKHYQFLTLNPGAAGKSGWQTVQTLLRFTIDGTTIDHLEVIELERH